MPRPPVPAPRCPPSPERFAIDWAAMRRLSLMEPISKGVALALWSVLLASIGLAFFLGAIPAASPQLLQSLATIGAILIPAYVVEVVWLVPRMGEGIEYEEWLGFVVGAGIAALLGIAVALLLGQHRAAGHANALDDLGLAWVIVSQLILGGALVVQPLLVRRFGGAGEG
jgi:hypothetical protein